MNDYFSLEEQCFKGSHWHYASARNVLLIVFGITYETHNLILIQQYRPPIKDMIISPPMGAFPESPIEELIMKAAEEAECETGYRVKTIEHFVTCYRSPGLSDEKAYIFFANYEEEPGNQKLHDDEIIQVMPLCMRKLSQELNKLRHGNLDSSMLLLFNDQFLHSLNGND